MFLTPSQNECESIVNKKGWNLSWGEDSQGASDPGGNSAWRGRNIWSWLMLIQNCDWINEIYVYSIIFKFLKESNPEQNQCASFTLKIARGDHIPGGWDIRGDTFQPCEGVLVSPVYPPPPPEKETLGGRQWVSLSRFVCPRGQTICWSPGGRTFLDTQREGGDKHFSMHTFFRSESSSGSRQTD